MITRDALSEMLRPLDPKLVAEKAGVSTRTIRRLIAKSHAPNLRTVEALLKAIDAIRMGRV